MTQPTDTPVDTTAVPTLEERIAGSPENAAAEERASRRVDVSETGQALLWLQANAGRGRLAGLFNRDGAVVYTPREGEDGYVPGGEGEHLGPAQVQRLDKVALAARVDVTHDVIKVTRRGEMQRVIFPDVVAARALAVPDQLPHVRPLAGVTHTPLLRPDGSVLDRPGYDTETKMLYLPKPGENLGPPVPDKPTEEHLRAARELLLYTVKDFAFVTDSDRANFIGALLTPFLRALTPLPFKLFVINAKMRGSGKTFLGDTLLAVHGGVFRSEMPENGAELHKVISSTLLTTTGPVVEWDNVTGTIRGGVLAGLLTQGVWSGGRELGFSRLLPEARNDRLWVLNGNNVVLGGDIPRRSFWCTIDPGVPDPHTRSPDKFAIKNYQGWIREQRADLVRACLVLARSWTLANGGTDVPINEADQYGKWTATVRAILAHAKITGTFCDRDTDRAERGGTDDDEWYQFMAATWDSFGEAEWTTDDVLTRVPNLLEERLGRCEGKDVPLDCLPFTVADKIQKNGGRTQSGRRSLSQWLRRHDGRFVADLVVRKVGQRGREVTWKVTRHV